MASLKERVARMCEVDELMKNSVLRPGIEQAVSLPALRQSRRQQSRINKMETEKTKGSKWYDLPRTEVTEEVKNDLTILQMRSTLNPKHFYKSNDLKVLPKYFQIGTVVDAPADKYDSVPKKMRKRTLVEELLADAEFKKYNKKRYTEIVASQKRSTFHRKGTKNRKKSKSKTK